jgi:hypothetical protein
MENTDTTKRVMNTKMEVTYHDFAKNYDQWLFNIYFIYRTKIINGLSDEFKYMEILFNKEDLQKLIDQLQYILNDKTFDELK